MDRRNLKIVLLFLIASVALNIILFGAYYSQKSKNQYHRSRMFEYDMLASLNKEFPIGTEIEVFLTQTGLNKSDIKKNQNHSYLEFRPKLLINESEYRDYQGFFAKFENNMLVSIAPMGPQPGAKDIDLSETPIGSKIVSHQRP